MLGGIIVNILLAWFIYSMILFSWGEEYTPTSSLKNGVSFNSAGEKLGFQDGDLILSIDGLDIVDFDRKNNKTLDRFFDIYISRANELVDLINRKIETSRFNSLISSNIVLTGYGAKSLTVQKLMKQKFNLKQFRLGSTKKINGSKTFLDNPSLVSAFGLLSYATNHVLEGENTDKNTKKNQFYQYFTIFFVIYREFQKVTNSNNLCL